MIPYHAASWGGDIPSLLPSACTAATERTSVRWGHLRVDLFLLELLIKRHTKRSKGGAGFMFGILSLFWQQWSSRHTTRFGKQVCMKAENLWQSGLCGYHDTSHMGVTNLCPNLDKASSKKSRRVSGHPGLFLLPSNLNRWQGHPHLREYIYMTFSLSSFLPASPVKLISVPRCQNQNFVFKWTVAWQLEHRYRHLLQPAYLHLQRFKVSRPLLNLYKSDLQKKGGRENLLSSLLFRNVSRKA